MNKNYYLPINSANISQYFSRGIILPSKYVEGWINDIQSKYNNLILLCNKPLTNETDCSLTVVFSDNELNEIERISENFSVYGKPLSIARVRNLNFKEEQQSKTTIYNIEKGDAFIPELISIVNKNEIVDVSELNSAKNINYMQDWKEKINLYNQVLGGFAIMRIAEIKNIDYPKNYFKCFSVINTEVERQIKDFNFNQDYTPYLNISDKKASAYGKINTEFVTTYAKKYENFNLPTKRGLIRLDEIDENKKSYIFSILAIYGADTGKTKKISDFISALINDSFYTKSREKLCLTFGINQGYSAYRNQYDIGDIKVNTKFKLNSEVDYTIIESVYQYVFNNRRDNTSFAYINEWCPKNEKSVNLQKYETYRIFDIDVIYKKKAILGSQEYLQELFQRFSKNSVLAPIFNLFKENVASSVQSITEAIYKKVKSDIELEERQKKHGNIKEQSDLKEQINNLQNENQKLANQLEQSPNIDASVKKVEEAQSNYGLNIGVDKNVVINKRKDIVDKTKKITELKVIGKYVGVKSISSYKASDIEKLRRLIIEKEEQINN